MMAEDWHTHVQQQYIILNDTNNSHISFVPHERLWSKCNFSSKNSAHMLLALELATAKIYFLCYGILVKTLYTTLYVLLHWNVSTCVTQPRFHQKCVLMKLTTFFISKAKQIYAKTLTVFESAFKIKIMSPLALIEVFPTLAVIWKTKIFARKRDKYKDLQIRKHSSRLF